MKCPSPGCGAEVGEYDRFCEKCGKTLRQGVETKWKIFALVLALSAVLLGFWMITSSFTKSPKNLDSTPTPTALATANIYPTQTITSILDTKIFTNSIDMEFNQIPAGEFDMGSPSNEVGRETNEGPVHRVKLANAFYIGKYEVTQKQWREIMGTDPSYFTGDDLPVEYVSWNDVQEFIKKLNEKEGASKYRLPSEAEWEYAARAGTTARYSFGDYEYKFGNYAWYHDNSNNRTHPVGLKNPNLWGLYDMHGNVWEWVQDLYHDSYNGAPKDGSAWESGSVAVRVGRGGGWYHYAGACRSAVRYGNDPGYLYSDLGFRLVRDI